MADEGGILAEQGVKRLKDGHQNSLILGYLVKGKTLTSLSALRLFNCLRLAGRIYELRRRGWKIKSTPVVLTNGKTVAKYWIET